MIFFRHRNRKSIDERKFALMKQIDQLYTEPANIKRQDNVNNSYPLIQAVKDTVSSQCFSKCCWADSLMLLTTVAQK